MLKINLTYRTSFSLMHHGRLITSVSPPFFSLLQVFASISTPELFTVKCAFLPGILRYRVDFQSMECDDDDWMDDSDDD